MTTCIRFRFESSETGRYVPTLGNSKIVSGAIATQNAGSSNVGIYYQVGGGGINGLFAAALTAAGQLEAVNAALVHAYDARFGPGAWARDRDAPPGSSPPLTSLLIPLTPGVGPVGSAVTGMMYSVGPILGAQGITDAAAYAVIYTDAMAEISRSRAAGHSLTGLRIAMLSTGIYASRVDDPAALFADSAACIINGIVSAATKDPSLSNVTILINTDDHPDTPPAKERDGFNTAAEQFGIPCHVAGFDVPLP